MAAAALGDGTVHLFGLLPGGGVSHRPRSAAGQWGPAAPLDPDGEVTAIAAAGWPGTALQLTTVPAGGGVWSRTRAAGGAWPAAEMVDPDPSVLDVYATGRPDGTLHVGTVPEIS